ncbi:hypothetical protein HMSSN139_51730 [Paenibacillus sp. HMSSN-139]|nr:hypothetical protein HMSSN139_51730 [Paenibacillus sp. HMSSN-139]
MDFITQLLLAAITAGTPLLLATLGGILTERAGIIQLGRRRADADGSGNDLPRLHPLGQPGARLAGGRGGHGDAGDGARIPVGHASG